jgi:NhaA family Na+:H+ antiporter
MVLPAVIYAALVLTLGEPTALSGWAIPTATDIAFALAVLAIFGRGLPRALRTFLLTLAVVDDLLAIVVIAVFYTDQIDPLALLASLATIAGFAVLVRTRRPHPVLLVAIGVVAWGFMHASGVHATIAGVLMGFTVPALARHGETRARTHTFDRAVRPWSAGFALPVFAFFSAGVTVVDGPGVAAILTDPVFAGVVAGLLVGKLIGVLGTTAAVTRLTPLRLPDAIGVRDLLPIGFLTGIGFTVSLLLTELSFPDGTHAGAAKLGILAATALAALLGALALRWDARQARHADMNRDGVTDTDTTPIDGVDD